jgi:hypothetical protein
MPNLGPWIVLQISKAVFYVTSNAGLTMATQKFLSVYGAKLLFVAAVTTYSAVQQRKAARAARAALNRGRTFMVREPDYPRQIIYGQIKTSGPIVFIDETGTNNEYLHIVIAVAGHQIQSFDTTYLGSDAVNLDGSGNVTTSPYSGFARVKTHLGTTTQTVDTDLVSSAPNGSPLWTTNHRLQGIAYIYVRLKWSAEVFPNGLPNISALISGKLVYDSRTTTTAYSNNWALCLADYLTDAKLGLGAPLASLNDTALQAAANESDVAITLNPSGTESQYTINGQVLTDTAPSDVIEQMVLAGAGFCGYIGGKWVIHAGAYRTPTVTLDEDDLRGPISVQTRISRREIFNAGKGTFMSAENDWQVADYPAVTNATYQAADNGVRIWADFEWPFTTSSPTAQRLTKVALERVRQEITVNYPAKLTGIQVQAGDNVMITNTRLGWSSKVFEVVSAAFVPEMQGDVMAFGYDLVLRETASGVWDWANGEETTIDLAPNTNLPNPRVVAAPTSLLLASGSTEIYQQVDGTVIPRIKATWTLPADEFVTSGGSIRIEFKKTAESTWIPWTLVRGDVAEEYITDVQDGIGYDVRIRSENTMRGVSSWVSDSITAGQKTSAPGAPTGLTATPGNNINYDGAPVVSYNQRASCSMFKWTAPADKDIAYYELAFTAADTDAAANAGPKVRVSEERYQYSTLIFSPIYWRIRTVDKSGNASSWTAFGTALNNSSVIGIPIGGMSLQESNGVAVSSIKTGQSGTPTPILARHSSYFTKTLTGGAPTEVFDYNLAGLGFSTSPDGGSVQINIAGYTAGYNKSGGSSSTVAKIFVATTDGSNIAAGTSGFNIILEEN